MKYLLFIIFILVITSCGETIDANSKVKKSEYISVCFEMSPGGKSYKELCECGYDRGISSMTEKEKIAYERNFSEVEDLKYILSAPAKLLEAQTECASEALDQESNYNYSDT
tara:strand:+ start:81 stop:416 length:336 start_codon:yes stop_codon:yes gene_type:complete